MSQPATVDVLSVVEKDSPDATEVLVARVAAARDNDARRRLTTIVGDFSAEPSGKADKGAVKKGVALFLLARDADAARWLAGSQSKSVRTLRARALLTMGRPVEALKALGEPSADDAVALAVAGEASADTGDGDAARDAATRLAKLGSAAEAAYLRGRAAEIEGDMDGAVAALDQAVAADPHHARALFRRARMEYLHGDEEDAIVFYRRAVDCPDAPLNALLNLGNLYEDRGEFQKARDCYHRALQADPSNERARLFDRDAECSQAMFYDEDIERRADKRAAVLRLPVTDFELSVRSRNCLAKMGVRTLGDLVQRSEAELLSYKNFGETSLQEIKDILAQKGLRLGMGKEDLAREQEARSILEGIGGDADKRKFLQKPLSELELSVRSRHCMNVLGLKTVQDLVQKSETELMTIKNFGQTSLNEVKQKLAELGLTLAPSPTK